METRKRKRRKVHFSDEVKVFAVQAPGARAVPVPRPVAATSQTRPYAERAVRFTPKLLRERRKISDARTRHAIETAFASRERDTAEGVMRLLWRSKVKRDPLYNETGVAAVAEDAEQAAAAKDVAELLAQISRPPPPGCEGCLSVEEVESVLLSVSTAVTTITKGAPRDSAQLCNLRDDARIRRQTIPSKERRSPVCYVSQSREGGSFM